MELIKLRTLSKGRATKEATSFPVPALNDILPHCPIQLLGADGVASFCYVEGVHHTFPWLMSLIGPGFYDHSQPVMTSLDAWRTRKGWLQGLQREARRSIRKIPRPPRQK